MQDESDLEDQVQRTARSGRRSRSKKTELRKSDGREGRSAAAPNVTLLPVKTSTPFKGYDEEEHQTQLLEDPLEVLQAQQTTETSRSMQAKQVKRQKQAQRNAPERFRSNAVPEENDQEPDKLVDLSVNLAMLLVKNHRKNMNVYKATKSAGIDNIISIVAAGCREAEQLDVNCLQGYGGFCKQ